jgi:hypothetical protein
VRVCAGGTRQLVLLKLLHSLAQPLSQLATPAKAHGGSAQAGIPLMFYQFAVVYKVYGLQGAALALCVPINRHLPQVAAAHFSSSAASAMRYNSVCACAVQPNCHSCLLACFAMWRPTCHIQEHRTRALHCRLQSSIPASRHAPAKSARHSCQHTHACIPHVLSCMNVDGDTGALWVQQPLHLDWLASQKPVSNSDLLDVK